MYDVQDEDLRERYRLAMGRIALMETEDVIPAPFDDYFRRVADFLLYMDKVSGALASGEADSWDAQRWAVVNRRLYQDILPENYESGYADPAYACERLGESYGQLLSFLYTQLRGLIVYQSEGLLEETVIHLELFIQVYNLFEETEAPKKNDLEQILYWFAYDYCDVLCTERVRQSVDPERDFAVRIIMDSDLSDPAYLYRYGEYVTEDELGLWRYISALPEETIDRIARAFTDGYRVGFEKAGKDLSRKTSVNIRYHLGFERVMRRIIEIFAQMGLRPVIYRCAVSALNRRGGIRVGYTGASPNPQYDFDHREDAAIWLDKRYVSRRLDVIRCAYEEWKPQARGMAGPAAMETFGETPFVPGQKAQAIFFTQRQQELQTQMNTRLGELTNRYIPGDERSFTIMAFPLPAIGRDFGDIFEQTLRINTLDQNLFRDIQQTLIDALNSGEKVHVRGMNGSHTDMTVALAQMKDPRKESVFENCLADVNIPVGEVFTSPKLEGTHGCLHVKQVYLNGLDFHDLELNFEDGMVTAYSCSNFENAEEGRSYIRSSILYHHDTLPLGEFAIGTNTPAYAMARKYHIRDRLPILIAEKTGPHFAVGDTCYSHAEDVPTYNPDGKECIARENSLSAMRHTDPDRAYFGCHTDITIPYDQLGLIEVIGADGTRTDIIRDGKFVLPGTEALNRPL